MENPAAAGRNIVIIYYDSKKKNKRKWQFPDFHSFPDDIIEKIQQPASAQGDSMEKNYRAELTGLLGDPVDGNPTGVMEEAAYRAAGLNYRYITMRVSKEHLQAAFEGIKAVGYKGLNLTMPHKIMIIPFLDELTEAARIIGAVNSVVEKDGRYIGENTDGKGFVRALGKAGVTLAGKHVTILGAGGAARAIAVECALAGADHITVVNRTKEKGEKLASLIETQTKSRADFHPWTPHFPVPADTDILIQATSVGLFPDVTEKPDIDYHTIMKDMVCADVVFNPVKSAFLKEAEEQGASIVTGIGMLVEQGALNFTLWTGKEAPVAVMYDTLAAEFQQ